MRFSLMFIPQMDFWLFLVYFLFVLLTLVGTGLCILLSVLLKKYNVFHGNFRIIIRNITIALVVNNLIQLGRFSLILFDWYTDKPLVKV